MSETINTALDQLQQQRRQLFDAFLRGKERRLTQRHTEILDAYFRRCFESSRIGPRLGLVRNPYAIIAVGGYGRGEQCVHSDVDLLFLFEKKIPDGADELIREIVYPLWDAGYDIGHATRSLKECVQLAGSDIEVFTAILDARLICGVSQLYMAMTSRLRKTVLGRKPAKMISRLVDSNQARHQRFGDSTYLLEPNLKEGQGGLRDYHTMLWIARIKSELKQPRDLEYFGYLSHDEYQSMQQALRFIWKVRNHLHHLSNRKNDQLHFEHQVKLAETLGYPSHNGQQPVERFLSQLHEHMAFIKEQHLMFLYEQGFAKALNRKRTRNKTPRYSGLTVSRDRLEFRQAEDILDSPLLLMRIFEESARLKVPLSAAAKRLVREFLHLAAQLSNSQAAANAFEQILATAAPTFNVLNEMLLTGFLEAFIPEMGEIVNRIQYDEYHLYPVDRHSLRTVQTIKALGTEQDPTPDDFCSGLYRGLKNRKLLLWAGLLHDIGKGRSGSDHAELGAQMARDILVRLGARPGDADTVAFLIETHLLLIKTATRRDINDEETAISCARIIQDPERLRMLYLLTVADSAATGPSAWNEWTATLLRSLFLEVLKTIEKGELATGEAVETVAAKKAAVLAPAGDPEARRRREQFFNALSPRYLLYTEATDIVAHMDLFQQLGSQPAIWDVATDADADTRRVTVCARDLPGLFANICGVFTANGIDILSAQIYTWRNNTALDIFEVRPPPDRIFEAEKWDQALKQLQQALSGELNLKKILHGKMVAGRSARPAPAGKPAKVVVDNESSSFFTIVEVYAADYPGLLFSIADALYLNQLDIWVAKIGAGVDQVVDVFYVRDFDGQRVDDHQRIAAIKTSVLAAVTAGINR